MKKIWTYSQPLTWFLIPSVWIILSNLYERITVEEEGVGSSIAACLGAEISSWAFQQRGWGLWGNAALSWQAWPRAMPDAQRRYTGPMQRLREHHGHHQQSLLFSFCVSLGLTCPTFLPRSCQSVCTVFWIIRLLNSAVLWQSVYFLMYLLECQDPQEVLISCFV